MAQEKLAPNAPRPANRLLPVRRSRCEGGFGDNLKWLRYDASRTTYGQIYDL